MRDLDRALADIVAIRTQLARDTLYHGYGPATLAATGLLALLMAVVQIGWLDDPTGHPGAYFGLWIATAVAAVALVAVETIMRSRRLYSRLADDLINNAIQQFLPSGVAGLLLYLVLARYQPESLWMVPGLWQVVVSLGIFSASRSLPGAVSVVAVWYLFCGLSCLATASNGHSLSPWAMGFPFGVGQLLFAAIVHRGLGATDAEG
ncbi:MAG TPA: hypothetical protein VGR70_14775 [Stellaceae bacterium]|nr:hypothetical protein [Stellaceae bacterium]